jgi:predicted metalloprotease with PDZ domain
MRSFHGRLSARVVFAATTALLAACGAAAQGQPAAAVQYNLRFDRPNSHLLEITVRAGGLTAPAAEFAMPAWSPGWYIINNYAKMVQEFRASDPGGKPLPWRKTDKQTWRVTLDTARAVTVRYKLYGNTLAVDWTQYNDRHAHIAGPATWMYLVGGKQRPVRLQVETPGGWRIATGMQRTGDSSFAAPDYDHFIDSPLEISDFAEQTFTVGGATHHFVVHDVMGRTDYSRVVADAQKAVAVLVKMMEPVAARAGRATPYADYWFLFHVWPGSGGGLEHHNSTQIFLGGDWAPPAPGQPPSGVYRAQLGVTAHEFFHAYNVKRMRPRPLGPFDYAREVYTPSLWISEGLTNYYEGIALLRSGLVTPEDYLRSFGQLLTDFENLPGRRERSIEETSWDTWFWYVGEGPAQTNRSQVDHSYYDGGEILGHFLDFAIRKATNNRKSLDDWMRLMYARYALPKPGFTPEQARRAVQEIAGRSLDEFFSRHISGKEPLPVEEYFAWAGIRVERRVHPERGLTGATFGRTADDQARVGTIRPRSPAMEAGLDRGDIVVEADGVAVRRAEFQRILESKKPAESLRLTVLRLGERREVTITVGSDPTVNFTFAPLAEMTAAQRAIFDSWSGQKR